MCMNDGHIYCTEEQVASELGAVLDMYDEVYRLLGVKDAHLRLSLRDRSDARGKYVDDERSWEWAEAALRGALAARGVDYELGVGHAAFYGPKIDVQVRTVSSGEETLSTVQLDFVQPKRLGLHYTAPSGQRTVPYCIHRAPLSTHERFVAFIVEKFGGSLPTWLSPLQVVVMPVSEAQRGYADEVVRRLRARFVRAEAAAPGATLARNVRDASERKVPNIVIVGRREAAEGKVTLRRVAGEAQLTLPLEEFERLLLRTIAQRSSVFAALEPA
jgi:threonyl-tRNA synthetase